jgi:hypothetical protein
MGSKVERMRLIRKIGKDMQYQIDLMSRLAASFVRSGKQVPQEVGQALGELVIRNREFESVKHVINSGGPKAKLAIERFVESTKGTQEAMHKLLNMCGQNNEGEKDEG